LRGVRVAWRYNPWAINQVYSLHQCDVLPDLCLARDWSHGTDLLFSKGIDDGGFASIGVTNKSNRNLFAV
jgi:hypothetical protein